MDILNAAQIQNRIGKWKCAFCGSRFKKLIHIEGSNNKSNGNDIGYSMACCHCGHVENFALTYDAIPVFVAGLKEGRVTGLNIECGIDADEVRRFCKHHCCECRPTLTETKEYGPEDRDHFSALKPVLEKYEGRKFVEKNNMNPAQDHSAIIDRKGVPT